MRRGYLVASQLALVGMACGGASAPTPSQELQSNVVLVTLDGVRTQEIFAGVDDSLLSVPDKSGVADVTAMRARFWHDSETERREALMPFLWTTIAAEGLIAEARVANPHKFSYPGYAELLTGRVVETIDSNDPVRIPRETILDVIRRVLSLEAGDVAAFGSWVRFEQIVTQMKGNVFANAGESTTGYDSSAATGETARWLETQERIPSPWEEVRYNAVTEGLALAYLKEHRPRFLYLAFDETDEWAHAGRYDNAVQALHRLDRTLERLWTTVQSLDTHRDRTTLIVTTDHGRGVTPDDWTSHGADVPMAENIWIAAIGAGVPPRGHLQSMQGVTLGQIASTVLELLNVDPAELGAGAAPPLPWIAASASE